MPFKAIYHPGAYNTSDTQPLHEAIKHNETGRLVNFSDHAKLASEVCDSLDQPHQRQRLAANARAFAQQNYDLKAVFLPKRLAWVQDLNTIKNTSTTHQKNWMQHV